MFATFITVALFAAANVAGYTLTTPKLTQCQDATINWDGAQGSVSLIAVPADDVCNGKIIADLGEHDTNSATWKVDVPAGTKLVLTTLDSADVEAWSAEIEVQPSDDTSCIRDEYKSAISSSASSTTASSTVVSSSSSSSSAAGTLVVKPTAGASTSSSGSTGNTNTNQGGPVGGVAKDPLSSKNGALTHATKPMLILGAISAVLAASL